MKKFIAIMMILATLVSLSACKEEPTATATDASDVTESTHEQMQASEVTPTTAEGEKPGKESTGQPDVQTPTTTEPLASTEPATETTAPATQPTQSTQPTTPVVTEPPHQHSYMTTVIAPTCNDKGYTKHTCSCGDSYCDTYTAALGHHYIDEVIAPTTTSQGYTKHTCDRCWYSYNDTYTPVVEQEWWDTEAAVAAVCADANAYIASLGLTVDPTSPCWVAPYYTHAEGSSQSHCLNYFIDGIDLYHSEGFTHMYVTYEPDAAHGGWIIYLKYQLVWGN